MTVRRITLAWYVHVVLWAAMLLGLGGMVIGFPGLVPLLIIVPVFALLCIVAFGFSTFDIRIGPEGISAASVFGFALVAFGPAEIADVSVQRISAVGDFLGWGYRSRGPGRCGFITRSGEALVVTAADGRTLTVTLDDADAAADELRSATGL